MATMRPIMRVESEKMNDSDSHSAKNGIHEAEDDRKFDENDDDMPLEPITRVPGQMDHGQPRFFLGKSEDSCDRGSLFALPC